MRPDLVEHAVAIVIESKRAHMTEIRREQVFETFAVALGVAAIIGADGGVMIHGAHLLIGTACFIGL
jgi:hypothetical protein